jgi:hypothetical protein
VVKWVFIPVIAVLGVYALTFGLYCWKEYMPHYEAGAVSELDGLHVIQQNYKAEHGYYARTFSQLGVPLGAMLIGDQLTWDVPYRYRIVDIKPIGAEGALSYHIEGRPTTYSFGSRRSYLMDETGSRHFTYQDRAARMSDRIDNPSGLPF